MHDSYYTIQVQQKGFTDWNDLRGGYPTNSPVKATTLEIAEDLIAKIDYPCKVRIIHVTKNILETRDIEKPVPLNRKALLDLIKDMPVLSTTAGCFYQVVAIEHSHNKSDLYYPHDTFMVRNVQTGAMTTFIFDRAAIVGDKLQVTSLTGSEYLFLVLKPVKLPA